jgi:hypothetical protein
MHGVLRLKENKIWGEQKFGGLHYPPPGVDFFFLKNEKCFESPEILPPSQRFAPKKISLVSMGGRAEGQTCADPETRAPSASWNNII